MIVTKEQFRSDKWALKAIILSADGFEDLELFVPYFRLLEDGMMVDVAAPSKRKITGKHGYVLDKVDMAIEDVDPNNYQMLVLPGGPATGGAATVRRIKRAQDIARSFMESNTLVAAICHGPYTLVSADVLRNRHMTSYPGDGVPDEIRSAGGIWEDSVVVVDGNLISSRLPADLPAFTREMLSLARCRDPFERAACVTQQEAEIVSPGPSS